MKFYPQCPSEGKDCTFCPPEDANEYRERMTMELVTRARIILADRGDVPSYGDLHATIGYADDHLHDAMQMMLHADLDDQREWKVWHAGYGDTE